MAVKLSPVYVDAQFISGIPANGAKVFCYAAGSTTKQTTYTDVTGTVPQANPIILNSRGEPANPIWLTVGQSYKFVFTASTDSDPPASPIRTIDNVTGVNDASLTLDQWVSSGVTPTYVSATQFTLPGDQTSSFTVNRRLKSTITAGTAYSTITNSVFTTLTTVTVVNDSTPLDSGLSAVQLGLITPDNTSFPILKDTDFKISGSSDKTKLISLEVDTNIPAATTRTLTAQSTSGTLGLVEGQIQPITASVGSNALTVTLNPTSLAFRSATLTSGTVNVRAINTALSVVVSSGSTLGSSNAVAFRIAVAAIDNAGTVELAVANINGLGWLDDTGVISTTAEGGAGAADSAGVWYSTTARSNVSYRVVGYLDITEATAGTYASAPTVIQGAGGQVRVSGTSMVRLNTANGYGSTNTAIRRFTNTVTNSGTDITYADSATLGGSFTINTAGVYAIAYSDLFSAASALGLSLNTTTPTTAIGTIAAAEILTVQGTSSNNAQGQCGWTGYLAPGSVIRAHASATISGTPAQDCQFTITRVA